MLSRKFSRKKKIEKYFKINMKHTIKSLKKRYAVAKFYVSCGSDATVDP